MSASSESRGRSRVADIIDLDRYMRGVRPSRHRTVHTRDRLIVDAGGIDRLPVEVTSSSSGPIRPRLPDYNKRFSHDSGVSDGSYLRQRHRPHRRVSESKRESSRTAGSNSSVREFKAACERALKEQQEQISRVTELCEKLVQPQIVHNLANSGRNDKIIGPNADDYPQSARNNYTSQNTNLIGECYSPDLNQNAKIGQCYNTCSQLAQKKNGLNPNINQISKNPEFKYNVGNDKRNFSQNVSQVNHVTRPVSPGTSFTSSSCSSPGFRMRDRHRSDSCKTYQLIMGKLDELSHLFATRRVPPTGQGRESSSVLVCDKLVATEDGKTNSPVVQVMHASRMSENFIKYAQRTDIPPVDTNHITVESSNWNNAVKFGSAGDNFDLDNPLHLYAQAKRLQALHANNENLKQQENISQDKSQDKLDSSLCALCRCYWRAVRRCITHQLFGTCT